MTTKLVFDNVIQFVFVEHTDKTRKELWQCWTQPSDLQRSDLFKRSDLLQYDNGWDIRLHDCTVIHWLTRFLKNTACFTTAPIIAFIIPDHILDSTWKAWIQCELLQTDFRAVIYCSQNNVDWPKNVLPTQSPLIQFFDGNQWITVWGEIPNLRQKSCRKANIKRNKTVEVTCEPRATCVIVGAINTPSGLGYELVIRWVTRQRTHPVGR